MKKRIVLSVALMLSLSAFADVLNISTPRTTLLLQADKSDELKVIYYGTKLSDADAKTVEQTAKDKFAAVGLLRGHISGLTTFKIVVNAFLEVLLQGINGGVFVNNAVPAQSQDLPYKTIIFLGVFYTTGISFISQPSHITVNLLSKNIYKSSTLSFGQEYSPDEACAYQRIHSLL